MAIEEKENQELTKLQDLIDLVERDPLPTNVFDVEDTDPLVLLGKLNEIEEYLRGIKSLIVNINDKSNEAITTALDAIKVAKQALEGSNTALESSNTALETANTALDTANNAYDQATSAHDTAGDALDEAVDAMEMAKNAMKTAQDALDQVTQGLGTKVYDTHDNLINEAKFTGHKGINVDMSEEDPNTFDIRLDNTITETIEQTHQQAETNKTNISALNTRVTTNESDIINLTDMLSATEELAQQATETLPNKADADFTRFLTINSKTTYIANNDDLHSNKFYNAGNYVCSQNVVAKTLSNCPTSIAFKLEIFNLLSTYKNVQNGNWSNFLMVLTDYDGNVWYEHISTEGNTSVKYKGWVKQKTAEILNLWNINTTPRLEFTTSGNTSHTLEFNITKNSNGYTDTITSWEQDMSTTGWKTCTFTIPENAKYYCRIGYNGNIADDKYVNVLLLTAGTYRLAVQIKTTQANKIIIGDIKMAYNEPALNINNIQSLTSNNKRKLLFSGEAYNGDFILNDDWTKYNYVEFEYMSNSGINNGGAFKLPIRKRGIDSYCHFWANSIRYGYFCLLPINNKTTQGKYPYNTFRILSYNAQTGAQQNDNSIIITAIWGLYE